MKVKRENMSKFQKQKTKILPNTILILRLRKYIQRQNER